MMYKQVEAKFDVGSWIVEVFFLKGPDFHWVDPIIVPFSVPQLLLTRSVREIMRVLDSHACLRLYAVTIVWIFILIIYVLIN